jgi:hypothetical protein
MNGYVNFLFGVLCLFLKEGVASDQLEPALDESLEGAVQASDELRSDLADIQVSLSSILGHVLPYLDGDYFGEGTIDETQVLVIREIAARRGAIPNGAELPANLQHVLDCINDIEQKVGSVETRLNLSLPDEE